MAAGVGRKTIVSVILTASFAVVVQLCPAQEARFELGQRVRAFEIAWEQQTDADARARAVPHLNTAVTNFFGFKLSEAARSLDQARFTMQSTPPSETTIWATALSLRPETRLADRSSVELSVSLAPFYKIQGDIPKSVAVHLSLRDVSNKEVAAAEGEVGTIPWQGKLPLTAVPEGDCQLVGEIVIGEDHIRLNPQTVSVVSDPAKRLKDLEDGLGKIQAKPKTTDRATLAAHLAILKSLLAKEAPETNYPAARLLAETEAALKVVASGGEYFGKARPGEFWITLADEHGTLPVRIMAPETTTKGAPLPLVIALHGAGGSENMFFDAYGNGKIVELCRKRGWLLVAPRLSLFGLGIPVDSIVAEIGRLYVVDKRRIFVVGHSMGAMQAINIAQQAREPFAAVAALSGGGRIGKPGTWKETAFLVIAGDQDFGLAGSRRLNQALRAAGVADVRLKEYKDAEHLGVVQAALPEVFGFFDEIAAKVSKSEAAAEPKK